MLFEQVRKNTNLDVLEVKFVCELFLDKIGLESERQQLVKMTAEKLEEVIGDLNNRSLIDYVMKTFVKNNANRVKLNEYLMDFFSRHTREDIPYVYATSNAGRNIVEHCLKKHARENEKGAIAPEVVTQVQKLFAEVTRKRYAVGFRNEGTIESYLVSSFDDYFIGSYSREIMNAKDQRSMYVKGSDGDVSLFELRSTEQLDERTISYNIPNFKYLAYLIYKGSKAIAYRDDSKNVKGLAYDLYSYHKFEIVKERYNKFIDEVDKEVRYSLKSKISVVDINARGYFDIYSNDVNKDQYAKRTYGSRQSFIEIVKGFSSDIPYREQFEILMTPTSKDVHQTARWFSKRNETPLFKEGKTRLEHEEQYWEIRQGLWAAENLINLLEENGIDPLSVPSDIFRDPDWFSKVEDLESYLKMYDNMKELEQEGESVDNIDGVFRNNELTKQFYGASLDSLKNRLLGDIKQILERPTLNGNRLYDIVDSNRLVMTRLLKHAKRLQSIATSTLQQCISFKAFIDKVTGANHYCTIKQGRILEWHNVTPGTLDTLQKYTTLAQSFNLDPNLGPAILNNMKALLSQFKKSLTDESYYDLIRLCSVLVFFSDIIVECLETLVDYECSDLGIVDIITKHKSFIALYDSDRSFRNVIDLPGSNSVYSCFPKATESSFIISKMAPFVESVIVTYKEQFEMLRKIANNVEEEKNKTNVREQFMLGDDEDILLQYARALDLCSIKLSSKEIAVKSEYLVAYKDAYMVYKKHNNFVKKKENGHLYYLHKSGVWVTAELAYDDIENLLNFGKNEII